jgi:solute carrier family 25 2-oxodicarboxylate transporter 21
MFREEGVASLYKGFVPKVLRLAPGGGILLLVVEFTLGIFRKGKSTTALHVDVCMMTCDFVALGPPYV